MNPDQNKVPESNPVPASAGRPEPVLSLGATIGIGAGVGVALGILMSNLAVGIAIGVALGAGVGAALEQAEKRRAQLPVDAPRK